MKPRHAAALALVGLVLLFVLTIEAAGINRSLRRIEPPERHRPRRPDGWLLLQPPYRIVGPYPPDSSTPRLNAAPTRCRQCVWKADGLSLCTKVLSALPRMTRA